VTSTKIQPEAAVERPWEEIPPRVAGLLRPAVPRMSDAVIAAIRERVPAYRRPLRGRFGAGIRRGVEEALAQFVDLIAEPGVDRAARDEVYRGLGRGEFRERRSLDSLLAAYRLGARVAWRHVAAIAISSRLDRKTLALLAEAVFAYIDELSALSVEGYAEAQSAAAGELQRRRRRLAALLLTEGPVDEEAAREAARLAGRDPPAKLAALAWADGERRLLARLPDGSLSLEGDGDAPGISLIPDPEAPRRRAELQRAARDSRAALGPPVPWLEAARSAGRALTAWRLMDGGVIDAGGGVALASDHLAELVAHGDESLIQDLAARRLEPLDAETKASRRRLTETLRSWLDHQGEVARVAEDLHVHPQTVRYRLGRLRDRLGDALDDPRARFELGLALRARESHRSE
jgi:PucR C-terminal helix-turn-helix domain